jgi:hypothetical protein
MACVRLFGLCGATVIGFVLTLASDACMQLLTARRHICPEPLYDFTWYFILVEWIVIGVALIAQFALCCWPITSPPPSTSSDSAKHA